MADDTKPTAETPPAPITNDAALETASAFFTRVESYLAAQVETASELGTHAEYSSLRGLLATTLATFRTGRPGGIA